MENTFHKATHPPLCTAAPTALTSLAPRVPCSGPGWGFKPETPQGGVGVLHGAGRGRGGAGPPGPGTGPTIHRPPLEPCPQQLHAVAGNTTPQIGTLRPQGPPVQPHGKIQGQIQPGSPGSLQPTSTTPLWTKGRRPRSLPLAGARAGLARAPTPKTVACLRRVRLPLSRKSATCWPTRHAPGSRPARECSPGPTCSGCFPGSDPRQLRPAVATGKGRCVRGRF